MYIDPVPEVGTTLVGFDAVETSAVEFAGNSNELFSVDARVAVPLVGGVNAAVAVSGNVNPPGADVAVLVGAQGAVEPDDMLNVVGADGGDV